MEIVGTRTQLNAITVGETIQQQMGVRKEKYGCGNMQKQLGLQLNVKRW